MITNTIVELAPHDEEVRRMVSMAMRWLEETLAGVLEEAREAGEIAKGREPRRLARLIVVAFEGSLVLAKTEQAGVVRDAMMLLEEVIVGKETD